MVRPGGQPSLALGTVLKVPASKVMRAITAAVLPSATRVCEGRRCSFAEAVCQEPRRTVQRSKAWPPRLDITLPHAERSTESP